MHQCVNVGGRHSESLSVDWWLHRVGRFGLCVLVLGDPGQTGGGAVREIYV